MNPLLILVNSIKSGIAKGVKDLVPLSAGNLNVQPAKSVVQGAVVSVAAREQSRYYASCRLQENDSEDFSFF
jgi:hypothetical protein